MSLFSTTRRLGVGLGTCFGSSVPAPVDTHDTGAGRLGGPRVGDFVPVDKTPLLYRLLLVPVPGLVRRVRRGDVPEEVGTRRRRARPGVSPHRSYIPSTLVPRSGRTRGYPGHVVSHGPYIITGFYKRLTYLLT